MAIDKTITKNDIDEFDKMLYASYQRLSRFRAVVTVNTGVAGVSRTLATRSEYLSGIQYPSWSEVPDSEKEEKAEICAKRVVRLENGLVLGALASANISSHVGAVDVDVTYATLAAVAQALIDQDADPIRNEVCIACPYQWDASLSLDGRIEKIDGSLSFCMDIADFRWEIECLSSCATNGIFDPAQGIGYAFTKESIGLTYNTEPFGDIGWDHRSISWQLTGAINADAVVRSPKGIVKILGPKA